MEDLDVGGGGEDFAEDRDQILIEFDGDDAGGAGGEVAGEGTQPGADLQDGIGGGDLSGIYNPFEEGGIGEEVLAEALFGLETVGAEEGGDV